LADPLNLQGRAAGRAEHQAELACIRVRAEHAHPDRRPRRLRQHRIPAAGDEEHRSRRLILAAQAVAGLEHRDRELRVQRLG